MRRTLDATGGPTWITHESETNFLQYGVIGNLVRHGLQIDPPRAIQNALSRWGNLRDWKYECNHDQGIDGPDQPD
jgi:hypothetical protein